MAKSLVRCEFRISVEDEERLVYQARRTGCDRTEIIRFGMHERLHQLEEQEAFYRQQKALREKKGAQIARVPEHRGPAPTGLGIELPAAPPPPSAATVKVPTLLRNTFPKYALMVEESDGPEERQHEIERVLRIFKEKKVTPEEAEAAHAAFVDFLEERGAARAPNGVVAVSSTIPVAGDIE